MINKKIRLIELFGGVGTQAMALHDLAVVNGLNPEDVYEKYRLVELDKYPVKSYNAVHGTNFEPMDITKISGEDLGIVDKNDFVYFLTYSFPCQDLSLAGKQAGMDKGAETRSGLLWEVERLLNEVDNLPDYLIMENVTQVHGKKNIHNFGAWISFLESKGYHNYWQDLEASQYGIPQHRNRTFMISSLEDISYEFPRTIPLNKIMRDMLDEHVDEKFYISNDKANALIKKLIEDGKLDEESVLAS